MQAIQQTSDRNLERLVREISEEIEKARPEEREELRQMTSDLIRQEITGTHGSPDESGNAARRPLNSVALGAFVLIVGAALSVVAPPVGLILLGGGLATIVLGALYRLVTK